MFELIAEANRGPLPGAADQLREMLALLGLESLAEAAPWEVDLSGSTILVMGGEGGGIRPRVASACDGLVALPTRGRVDSLNVSAAAAALLFEAVRQRS
jgi:23S rRNA (guanosine2251-2'-O)-methyltransferase